MAQNVVINSVTYQSVPEVDIPLSGGGTAKFYDTSSATVAANYLLNGYTAYGASGLVTGNLSVISVSQDSTTKVLTIS